jgi:hypothetical protein
MHEKNFAPNFPDFHRSIGAELTAVKDRIRHLIRHWPTDGGFKESVLRYVLRRFLPETLCLGTGFVVTQNWASPQMDILIVSRDAPRLFSDGDLLIVSPDAVRWAVEVKTKITTRTLLRKTVLKLAEARATWSEVPGGARDQAGLFIYQAKQELAAAALYVLDEARAKFGIQVGSITVGPDVFIEAADGEFDGRPLNGWVATIDQGMSAAHFVHHMIQSHSCRGPLARSPDWRMTKSPDVTFKYLPHNDDPKERNSIETL